MSKEELLKITKEYLREGKVDDSSFPQYHGNFASIIMFASQIYKNGFDEGYEQHRKDILGEELYYD